MSWGDGDRSASRREFGLGIPTVVDRLITQAIMQVMSPIFDPHFSEHNYGFRPGRSAHQAVRQMCEHIAEGHRWVVDLDLKKFFDRVNHDVLMSRVARRVKDKRLLKLIRCYLKAGIMEARLESQREAGTPQGSPLSPLLSNIMLDEFDKELERRGHRFCRYADDVNIYVGSKRAGERVMASLTHYLESRLKLQVNRELSLFMLALQVITNRLVKRRSRRNGAHFLLIWSMAP